MSWGGLVLYIFNILLKYDKKIHTGFFMKLRWLNPLLLSIVPNIAALYSCFVGYTTSLKHTNNPLFNNKKYFFDWKQGVILTIWHSRFFYLSFWGKGKRVFSMISASKDGELITRTIAKLRLYAIRGSSSKFGHEAMYDAAELLKRNYTMLMIPDGPRGPCYKVKPGIIRLSQLSGRPILPCSFSSTKGIFFPSWDRFFVPFPWGQGVLAIGEPIYVPAQTSDDEFEQYRLQLEFTLTKLQSQADDICGRDPEQEIKSWKKRKKS